MQIDQVVAQWSREEQAVRARLLAPGIAAREQVRALTGMQMF